MQNDKATVHMGSNLYTSQPFGRLTAILSYPEVVRNCTTTYERNYSVVTYKYKYLHWKIAFFLRRGRFELNSYLLQIVFVRKFGLDSIRR